MKSLSKLVIGAVASVGILASAGLPASATTNTTTVYPESMQGWEFKMENNNVPTSSGSMVLGPDAPPAGTGSANLSVGDKGSMVLYKDGYEGMRLDSITTLQYATHRTSGRATSAASFQFTIDTDVTDDNNEYQGRLTFEPRFSGNLSEGEWQTWNMLSGPESGSWWRENRYVEDADNCGRSNPCTWEEILEKFPDIGVHSDRGRVSLKTTFGQKSMNVNVDNLVINSDVYDFELIRTDSSVSAIDLGISTDYSLLAGAAITTGASNVLPLNLGSGAAITTGADNEIIGNLNAGAAITTGADNEISGNLNAGAAITTGASNTLSGSQSPGLVTPIASFLEAMASLDSAMADAFSRSSTLLTAELGATTLESGVYSAPAFFTLTGSLTLDAKNNPNAVFIIRSPGYISTAAGASIELINGAQASNVFLITGSYFSAGAGAELAGNIMATSYVTLGADAGLKGRILSQSGYITLGANATLEN
jgi:hypothetical protein